jgi:pimeloyl-ACP methyl ester carboxylesterase
MATRRIDVGEVRLSVAEAGEPGEPVVLLHGFPELAHSWRHQLPALAEAGFHAIAPDLRGYGDSDRPAAVEEYAAPKLVGDVAGLIAALGYETAHVVGHDWGGAIAWALAARRPELVRTLTAINGPHPVAASETRQEPEQQQKAWYMLLFNFAGVAEAWLSKDDFANFRRFVFDTAAPGTFPPEDRERFVAAMARDGALTAALNWYRANIPPSSWLSPPPDLPPVTAPTMVIWGEADVYMGEPVLRRSIAKAAGPLRVERLPGVSHWVQQEAPEAVSALLVDFLGAHRTA